MAFFAGLRADCCSQPRAANDTRAESRGSAAQGECPIYVTVRLCSLRLYLQKRRGSLACILFYNFFAVPIVYACVQVNWHKGTALEHLLDSLGLKGCPDVVAVYIGDDHTDEDAFKALRDLRQGMTCSAHSIAMLRSTVSFAHCSGASSAH